MSVGVLDVEKGGGAGSAVNVELIDGWDAAGSFAATDPFLTEDAEYIKFSTDAQKAQTHCTGQSIQSVAGSTPLR